MRLIINADDFGMCKGKNIGVIEAYRKGIVTSSTLMNNMPGTLEAYELAKSNPGLDVGIHLNITEGKPLCENLNCITNSEGEFIRINLDNISDECLKEIELEWRAQIERFINAGLTPSHFDSHHHVHFQEKLYPLVIKLAKEYGVAIRPKYESSDVKQPNIVDTSFYDKNVSLDKIKSIIDNSYYQNKIVEIMCHPSFIDPHIYEVSGYAIPRVVELSILTSDELKNYIKERNIELISFRDL